MRMMPARTWALWEKVLSFERQEMQSSIQPGATQKALNKNGINLTTSTLCKVDMVDESCVQKPWSALPASADLVAIYALDDDFVRKSSFPVPLAPVPTSALTRLGYYSATCC
eukprot:5986890-Amphidinium_carterae.1